MQIEVINRSQIPAYTNYRLDWYYVWCITCIAHQPKLVTTQSARQLHDYAKDNIIARCADDVAGARADSCCSSSHPKFVCRRRCANVPADCKYAKTTIITNCFNFIWN